MNEIEAELQQFVTAMLIRQPFYGDILLKIPIVRDDSIPTACTDGRMIRWSGRFFANLTPAQRRYVLMHEVFHTLLMHPSRLKGRKHRIWNIASDIIVNRMCDGLRDALKSVNDPAVQLARPANGIFSAIDVRETAENLYGKILADSHGNTVRVRKKYTRFARNEMPAEPDACDILPDLIECELSAEEEAALEETVREMIRDAAEHTRGTGGSVFLPRDLIRMIRKKPLNWKTLLREYLTQSESDDTSYTTPERKYLHMEMILPGHCISEQELENVWAFVDSSGSISSEEMNGFLTELFYIVKDFHCEMNIAYWDTSVTDVYRNIRREADVLKAVPKHSGGTNINCVYRWAAEHKVRPYVTLILTDGEFGTPDSALMKALPARNTILVLSTDNERESFRKIGRIARLEPKP